MKKYYISFLVLSSLSVYLLTVADALLAQNTIPLFKPGTLRALIFSGRNNHDWRTTTPILKEILLETGKFDVRVVEEPAGTNARTLEAYDVLILDYNGPRWGEETEKAVEEFVKSGKGLVAVHGASWAFNGWVVLGDGHKRMDIIEPAWPEYRKMIGGYWSDEEPKSGHGKLHTFSVKFMDHSHPVPRGMAESFLATDELYHRQVVLPHAHVLATAFDDPHIGGTGKEEPILWYTDYGKGRVFYTALGHDEAAMREPGFVTTFARAAEWAAKGTVTLPAEIKLTDRPENAPKILVVTGGHDYETEFYAVFNSYNDVIWDHALSNHQAFGSDIRKRYDAVVLYDMSNEISEAEKENLKKYVESGKGIIVLHHAIADYVNWEWWYRDVVGGKYLLEPDLGMPASTYRHDEELIVWPEGDHPVIRGVNRMHIWDETYKGMWISPSNTVLLRTDNPTSDGPVAWVSPYDKSRVVVIQLGHDRHAFRHPMFRKLVHNAILWSVGKIEQ